MPRKPQPVPPIFQPEVGAEAVYWAAHTREREVLVGWPTVQAIWGQRFIPGLLDRFLASRAWDGQMRDEFDDHAHAANLYGPVPGEQAAHGSFEADSTPTGPAAWITTHVGALVASLGTALLALGALRVRRLVRRP